TEHQIDSNSRKISIFEKRISDTSLSSSIVMGADTENQIDSNSNNTYKNVASDMTLYSISTTVKDADTGHHSDINNDSSSIYESSNNSDHHADRPSDGRHVYTLGNHEDIKLGWKYDSATKKFSSPKTPRKYRHEEYISFDWIINNKSDMKIFPSNIFSYFSWFKDYQDSTAQEIIRIRLKKKYEKRACENIDNPSDQMVVTSLNDYLSVDLLLFYDVAVPGCFKSDLNDILDSFIMEENIEIPTSISNGIIELIFYNDSKVSKQYNVLSGLKYACRQLKDKKSISPCSVFISDGKVDKVITK
ncbi:unnamed protein product, partial [Meganyctiphanes norvegica]